MLFENQAADRRHYTPPGWTSTTINIDTSSLSSSDDTPPLTPQTEWHIFQQAQLQQQKPSADTLTMIRDNCAVVHRGDPGPPPPSYPGEDRNAANENNHHRNNIVSNASNGVGEWTKCELLGRGAHGKVYRGVVGTTGESIAVKQIQINGMGRSELHAAENEIRMVPLLRHPNVVRFLGIEQAEEHLNIFLEYLNGGSLRRHLGRKGRMSEDETAHVTREMLTGLSYLHSQGITHRDIKGANVLLSNDGEVKLADFGTSKCVEQESVVSGIKGTPHWMAPEVIRGQESSDGWFQADVWSVGCTVVEMLTGKMPWPDMPNAMAAMFSIANGEPPPMNRRVSTEASLFIAACCVPDPKQRHTVERLLKHPFLARARPPPPREGVVPTTGHSTPPSDELPFPCRPLSGGEQRTPELRVRIDPPPSHPRSFDFNCTPVSSSSSRSGSSSGGSNGGGSSTRATEGRGGERVSPVGADTRRPPCRSREIAGAVGEQQRWWSRPGGNPDRSEEEDFQGWKIERPADRWEGDARGASGEKTAPVAGVVGLTTMQVAAVGDDNKHEIDHHDSPPPAAAGDQSAGRASFFAMLRAKSNEEQQQQQQQQQQQMVKKQRMRGATSEQYPLLACSKFRTADKNNNNSNNNDFAATSTPSLRSSESPPPRLRQPRYAKPLSTSLVGNVGVNSYCSEVVDSPGGAPPPPYGSLSCGTGVGRKAVGSAGITTSRWTSPRKGGFQVKVETAIVAEATSTSPTLTPNSTSKHRRRRRPQHIFMENHAPCLVGSDGCSSQGQSPLAFCDSWGTDRSYDRHLGNRRNSYEEREERGEEEEDLIDSTGAFTSRVTKFDSPQRGNLSIEPSSLIATSPVSAFRRKLMSTLSSTGPGGEMCNTRSMSNSSNDLRRLAGYSSPLAVVQAAREQIGQQGADQTRPDDPITGEYSRMQKWGSLQEPVDSGREKLCWRSRSMLSNCMRTKSAGVLGASPKLPPLERHASRGDGPGGAEGHPPGGGFDMAGSMRLIASAPTCIEFKSPPPAAAPTAVRVPVVGFGNRSGNLYGDLTADHCGGAAAITTPVATATADPCPREVRARRAFHRPLNLAPIRTGISPSTTPIATGSG